MFQRKTEAVPIGDLTFERVWPQVRVLMIDLIVKSSSVSSTGTAAVSTRSNKNSTPGKGKQKVRDAVVETNRAALSLQIFHNANHRKLLTTCNAAVRKSPQPRHFLTHYQLTRSRRVCVATQTKSLAEEDTPSISVCSGLKHARGANRFLM